MTDEMLEAARRAVRNPKPSSAIALDATALAAARGGPQIVALSSVVDFLSGGSTSANKANNYYTNAANSAGGYYGTALNNIVNSTGTGSPAATTFGNEEMAALQPKFNQQDQQLGAKEAAMGIGSSGAGKADFSQLGADQSATLAGLIAPLYSQSLGAYNQGQLGQAGAQSGIAGQGAGAANNAYGQALNNFYGAASAAGGAYGEGGGSSNPYSATSNTVLGDGGIGDNAATATYL